MQSDRAFTLLILLLAFSLVGFLSSYNASITGAATSKTTTSSAVIEKYFSINASGNLSAGIDFGTVTMLPTANQNASLNWNDTSGGSDDNETLYWVTVEMDSNTPVDFCILADAFNTSGGDEIGIGNYTFADSNWNNMTYPGPIDEQTMSVSAYVAAQTNIAVGSSDYLRYWLDVPATTPSGTYNNTVTILGTSTGVACR